ncbi:MAG TPA: methyltransferase domain-containing protein [Vicinamibacteria bacterium]|jgi:dolichol-phosphate mannosyltransferase
MAPDLTVVLPALHEGPNLQLLLPRLRAVLDPTGARYEILVISPSPDAVTREAAAANACRLLEQRARGYGGALREALAEARGEYVLTMDADLSHPPDFAAELWRARADADILIASRWVKGGTATMPLSRKLLSRILNRFFARGLGLPVRDLSSGFRLYRRRLLRPAELTSTNFDVLQEILVRLYAEGWSVREVPLRYEARAAGSSNARVIPFGLAYLRTFARLWSLRNSIASADYDDRAHDSIVPLQRYWQRTRFRHVVTHLEPGARVLDVGCGSSRIISALPAGSVALDVLPNKLRYARRFGRHLVLASGGRLPFPDASFPCVVCSQVVEHVPRDVPILEELDRVLAPGGRLILGTPDYGSWQWPLIEAVYSRVAPGAYAHEHITHYTRRGLVERFEALGYRVEASPTILRAELILVLRKAASPTAGPVTS